MAEQTKRKLIEIDLHLVKRSRWPVGAQAGNDKLATGMQAKRTLNTLPYDHTATGHIIEDMLTASNLILLYDETATPTLYHRSTVRRAHQT